MNVKIEKMLESHLELINLTEFDDFWNANMLKEELSLASSYYIIARCDNMVVRICWNKYNIR
ncbi:MAG: hypothetical protein HFJ51_02765 [Clostridia bacterium]|nr:hypothetical protein [Clostridia bacterium]